MRVTGPSFLTVLLAFSQGPATVLASPNCPLIGPEFPPPQRLAENPIWLNALTRLAASFDYIDTTNVTGIDRLSYSIQVFSTNPGAPILWERHRTAKNLPADTLGVKSVDGDTVYRLGSVSKVITVLTFLAEAGDTYWNLPITKFIPELAKFEGRSNAPDFDPLRQTNWDDITLEALAAQVSGLERDYGVLGEITQTEGIPQQWMSTFPSLTAATKPSCGTWPLCTRQQFFKGLENMFPSFPPWQTAGYSNIGYQLLAYALENITKKKFVDILTDRVIKPLGLKHTFYTTPNISLGIIPGDIMDSYWGASLGEASPGGNMYSSPNDLSAIGRAILSSKIIRPSLTRRWLNPVTFTSDYAASVGSPWGIRRIQLSKFFQPHRTLSVFTKAGTFRRYTSFLTLLRDFNMGFTIMIAGKSGFNNFQGADLIGAHLIPAYDAVARYEAHLLYSGYYVAIDPAAGQPLLTTWLSISTNPNKPGLGVDSWYSNGTDMGDLAWKLQTGIGLPARHGETRLYYTQLESKTPNGGKNQAWKAVFEDTGAKADNPSPPFSSNCGSWVGLTGVTYGSLPLDEFVFNFDSTGRVLSVTNLALRATYYKIQPTT